MARLTRLRDDINLRARLIAFVMRQRKARCGHTGGVQTTDYVPFSGMPILLFADLRTDALVRLAEFEIAKLRGDRARRLLAPVGMRAAA